MSQALMQQHRCTNKHGTQYVMTKLRVQNLYLVKMYVTSDMGRGGTIHPVTRHCAIDTFFEAVILRLKSYLMVL